MPLLFGAARRAQAAPAPPADLLRESAFRDRVARDRAASVPSESCYAADHLPPGPAPDRRVFGIPAPAEVPDTLAVARRRCTACDAGWTGAAACWCCGQAVTG